MHLANEFIYLFSAQLPGIWKDVWLIGEWNLWLYLFDQYSLRMEWFITSDHFEAL